MNSARIFFFLFCLCCFAACTKEANLPGEVATVNGQGISFRELESNRIRLFSGCSPEMNMPDNATLHAQYRYALGRMIEEVLICQYMQDNGLEIVPALIDEEEKRIRADYPEGAFEEMMAEEVINRDLWRESIRRRLLVERFLLWELRPDIAITSDEVQQYYREHSSEFIIPEQWHFIQLNGSDRKDVGNALNAILAGKNTTDVQREFLVNMHDISTSADLLPKDVNTELAPLQPQRASKIKKADGEFRAFVLLEKKASSVLDTATISRNVERILVEEKMRSLYAAWMENRLKKAYVRITPVLTAPAPSFDAKPGLDSAQTVPESPFSENGNLPFSDEEPLPAPPEGCEGNSVR